MWLSDLDSVAHDSGIGAPPTITTLKRVDENIGRVEEGLEAAKLLDDYDIWVSSDHGFSTYTGAADLASILKPYARPLPDGSPRIVAGGGAIYVRDGDETAVAGITGALQRTPRVGAIFTRGRTPGSLDGHVAGTLSFDSVRWQHDRSAQILFSPEWTDAPNAGGWRGSSASNGTAGHGGASPWDVHNTLIAAGPDLKRGLISMCRVPTSISRRRSCRCWASQSHRQCRAGRCEKGSSVGQALHRSACAPRNTRPEPVTARMR